MRYILSLVLLLGVSVSEARSVTLDAPPAVKHYCSQGDRKEVILPTVEAVIRNAQVTKVIVSIVEADCINGKGVAKDYNTFYAPSLTQLSEGYAIASEPKLWKLNAFTYRAQLQFDTQALAEAEQTFLLTIPVSTGQYDVLILTTPDGAQPQLQLK
ncbi:hypothetical protein [Bdellovibrio bacteriovorus]|uniref:Uncharacterized protein n=1 Tax=Bdellovibrio bacteriovorus TaxID=959 RepID=A0A150WKZ1_BDEBC|nr:hypothetical protein [Bdellovibrio bacteriovorus]KYG64403.1 hypothetical protein AZI85_02985 [Bdellovibrio bacteriovorus]